MPLKSSAAMQQLIQRLASALIMLSGHTVITFSQTWNEPIEVPDRRGGGGDIGTFNSIATINGHPAIATLDRTHQCIRFVRAGDVAGTTWGSPMTIGAAPINGTHIALAEVNGRPAIAYQSAPYLDLMYIRANDANGDSWGAPVTIAASGDMGKAASLAVVNGRPAISYFGAGAGGINRLYFVRASDADGTTWEEPLNPESLIGIIQRTELKIVNGAPAIVFGRAGNTRYIRAADADGITWNSGVTIVTGSNNGTAPTLAVVDGTPCIAFHNVDASRLIFRRASTPNGDSWGNEVTIHASSGNNVGGYARILDVGGIPAVVYQHVTNSDLLYARATDAAGTTWTAPVVLASDGLVGSDISAALVDGRPAAACYDDTNNDLLFVHASNATGTGSNAWNAPLHIDTHPALGEHVSQALVNGMPALAYFDASNQDLRYIRALDTLGTQWTTSITVDSIGDVGAFCRLLIVNGKPAIAYFDALENVQYVRANDAIGDSWGTPISLDNSQSGPRGQGIALAIIAGRPAVAYQNNTNANVRYMRASDANGDAWPTIGYTLGSSRELDVEVALIDLFGRPAVAFNQLASGTVVFTTGTNADFSAGASVNTTVTTGFVDARYPSLNLVNGNPAMSYWSGAQDELKYTRATNTTGAVWSFPVGVDPVGGRYGVLGIHQGLPAIVYRGSGMRFVKAADVNGTSWADPTSFGLVSNAYNSMVVDGDRISIAYQDIGRQQPYLVTTTSCALNTATITTGGTITAQADGVQYQWLDCSNDFLPVPGATGQSFTTTSGTYAVQLTTGACVDTSACVQIVITDLPANGGPSMQVFPNPTNGKLTIRGMKPIGMVHLSLLDATGRTVVELHQAGTSEVSLDLTDVRSGAYLLRSIDEEGTTIVHRIAVE